VERVKQNGKQATQTNNASLCLCATGLKTMTARRWRN